MAKFNRNVSPYYDDYDSAKKYTHLLAVPGRVAQAREITQIQSTVKDIIKNIGDSILKDGNVIEGCQIITSTVSGSRVVTVTAGKIYLNGMVLPVAETTLTVPTSGGTVVHNAIVGVKLNETLITDQQDISLRDPALQNDNFGKAGCDRVLTDTEVVIFTPDAPDPDAAILSTLIDGEVAVENMAPEYDKLTQTLARRTNDESGSYIVEGLNVRLEESSNTNKFNVVVESGKAYVLGYELKLPAPRRIPINRSLTYRTVTVPMTYNSSASYYRLSSAPYVKAITSVSGISQKEIQMTSTVQGGRVEFPEGEEIFELVSVVQGGTTFSIGRESTNDCYKDTDDGRHYLQWTGNTTDNTLTLNTNYTVTYKYTKTFVNGTDYELIYNTTALPSSSDYHSHGISWITAGSKPVSETNFSVTYDSYYARKDVVYIDYLGNVDVMIGTPNVAGKEVIPDIPTDTLALATISNPPGGEVSSSTSSILNILASNIGLTRFTMNDIQRLLKRIRTLEYDQAILSLNDEAKQYTTTSTKKGIWTDPLVDFSKLNYSYDLNSITYDVTLDLDSGTCYLPAPSTAYDAVYDTVNSTSQKYRRAATLKKVGESVVLSQSTATKSFAINPYSAYPQLPEISITPSIDFWIDDEILVRSVAAEPTSEMVSSNTQHIESTNRQGPRRAADVNTSFVDLVLDSKVRTEISESVISEEAITHIRSKEIIVEGINYHPNLDNIFCTFDSVPVTLTPISPTIAGTLPNTVKADSTGSFKAKFNIPAGILTGVREVRAYSSIEYDGWVNSAFALYTASGTKRTVQRTVTTLTNILFHRVTTVETTNNVDPVAQTFMLNRMTMLSGINLYFEQKPTGDTHDVTCEIREVNDGNITSEVNTSRLSNTIRASKTLHAADITVSSDATVAQRFDFDDPVLLEANKEYAFVIRSSSQYYRVWVSELGGTDVVTNSTVLANPYMIGVMMSSSNNSTWTAHQTTDVKFDLIAANYNSSADVIFDNINYTEAFSRVYLLAESINPSGTTVSWYYSTDSGVTYQSIYPYSSLSLGSTQQNIKLKATMTRTSSNNTISPMIALESVTAVLSKYSLEGYYISKNIPVPGLSNEGYEHVDIILDTYSPAGTDIKIYLSTDQGTTIMSTAATEQTTTTALDYGWVEKTYTVDLDTAASNCMLFIKLESTNAYTTPAFRRVRMIMS